MRKASVLFLISLYLTQGVLVLWFSLSSQNHAAANKLLNLLPVCVALSILVGAANILSVVRKAHAFEKIISQQSTLNNIALALKLSLIPFWIINIFIWITLTASFIVIPGFQIFLPAVFLGVAFAYFVLVVTSSYSICAAYVQFRKKNLSSRQLVRYTILQLLFVMDIISYIWLYFKLRRLCHAAGKPIESTDDNAH